MSMFKKTVLTLLLGPIVLLAVFVLYAKLVGPFPVHITPVDTPAAKPAPKQVQRDPAADAKNAAFLKQIDEEFYRKQISADMLRINDIASRFNDVNQVAAATTRIALAPLVQQLQALRRESEAITVHQCLTPALSTLSTAIAETTAAYLSFMTSGTDVQTGETKQHITTAQAHIAKYLGQRDSCVTW